VIVGVLHEQLVRRCDLLEVLSASAVTDEDPRTRRDALKVPQVGLNRLRGQMGDERGKQCHVKAAYSDRDQRA
jgi:hypothetical protein